ncbi:MAG TPA: nucleotidyl transferase AbiEii/AbiGii toxin family protein [Candidatus Cloacimonadota bacterium]|nr:nucleotidyl transferase AbiEii/AbiGii toxin family protein [Candidatus Cloacimonadales bacterium]HOE91656.1 nucleotidyl transferase AbiEii/AbiGii toxin family protein [Candidatus Cloacimonadota bacterium]HPK41137.1 nucleotidyl transferase AbiEii/AbiGii toxin family protein [Candidatus Cloacimonadota bacterium]HPY97415.1 nucleotidyl transferase AbiEii/AbiGii toxin family protein [Candidatus Cloacimonadota bacterium]
MSGKAMSLKAKIRNLAREKNMSAQVVLQNYMFERFLARLSKSSYKNNFILKGGILIAAIVGIDNRSTMDMDATIKNYPISIESLTKAINEICNIFVDDNVFFILKRIEAIRDDDFYGGYRASIISEYDNMTTPLQIDITAGDAITPKEILYLFKMIFKDGSFSVWAYNIETILAEKVETILRRGELNTRPRDFYDVYILATTQDFKYSIFTEALKRTTHHRGTTHITHNMNKRLEEIGSSDTLKSRWLKYTKDYRYADGIAYENIIDTIKELVKDL